MTDHRPRPIDVFHDECMARAEAERAPAVSPSVVVSADRATLLRAADWFDSGGRSVQRLFGHQAAAELRRMAADGPSRVAAEEQPAETQDGDREQPRITPDPDREGVILHLPEITYIDTQVWAVDVGLTTAGLAALRAALAERPAVGEQPDTQTREARLVELRVAYRIQLRDNDTADWKPSHPSLDYEDREDADESAAMGRDYFPSREYRVVTRTTTITEQP